MRSCLWIILINVEQQESIRTALIQANRFDYAQSDDDNAIWFWYVSNLLASGAGPNGKKWIGMVMVD
jgi:hypothetical protein